MQASLQLIITAVGKGKALVSLTALVRDGDNHAFKPVTLFEQRRDHPDLGDHTPVEQWAYPIVAANSELIILNLCQLLDQGQRTLPEDLRRR